MSLIPNIISYHQLDHTATTDRNCAPLQNQSPFAYFQERSSSICLSAVKLSSYGWTVKPSFVFPICNMQFPLYGAEGLLKKSVLTLLTFPKASSHFLWSFSRFVAQGKNWRANSALNSASDLRKERDGDSANCWETGSPHTHTRMTSLHVQNRVTPCPRYV